MEKLLLLYDGQCRFCEAGSARLVALARAGAVQRIDRHDAAAVARHPHVPPDTDARAIQLIKPDGSVASGAEAIALTLATRPLWRVVVWLYWIPVLRQVTDAMYRLVARNRYRIMGKKGECAGDACGIDRPAAG